MEWWESDKIYLKIEEDILPVEPSKGYTLSLSDYDNISNTEAGTRVRNITRTGIPHITVSFDCDISMLQSMRTYRHATSLSVYFFNPFSSDGLEYDLMFVTNYKEQMLADTSDGGFWKVSFELEDLGDV